MNVEHRVEFAFSPVTFLLKGSVGLWAMTVEYTVWQVNKGHLEVGNHHPFQPISNTFMHGDVVLFVSKGGQNGCGRKRKSELIHKQTNKQTNK